MTVWTDAVASKLAQRRQSQSSTPFEYTLNRAAPGGQHTVEVDYILDSFFAEYENKLHVPLYSVGH